VLRKQGCSPMAAPQTSPEHGHSSGRGLMRLHARHRGARSMVQSSRLCARRQCARVGAGAFVMSRRRTLIVTCRPARFGAETCLGTYGAGLYSFRDTLARPGLGCERMHGVQPGSCRMAWV